MTAHEDEFAESLIPVLHRPVANLPKSPDPYRAGVAPEVGGEVNVEVSGWGYWHVWIGLESYVDGFDQTAMGPADAFRLAWYLVRAGLVCARKRFVEQRHIRKAQRRATRG